MTAVRVIIWFIRILGLGVLLLGLLFWIVQIDLIVFHMLFGLTLALALLILGFIMVFNIGVRLLGVIAIVYAIILPIFGMTQSTILVGNLHWLIQTAHLLVGLGALALAQVIYTRYTRLHQDNMEEVGLHSHAR
jgi:hypothetical protein